MKELASLEDQMERRRRLENQGRNKDGQRLLGYTEGFTWRPKCHYVSNVGKTSDLKHRCNLRGCQRRSCEGCFQWSSRSPYENEDFIFEGYKVKKVCQAYVEGTVGRREGNKCLDDRPFWEEDKGVNKDRRYVCGARKLIDGKQNRKSEHFTSKYRDAPGGQSELASIAERVNAFLDAKLPLRPNGEEARIPEERGDRHRSKSRSKERHQPQ